MAAVSKTTSERLDLTLYQAFSPYPKGTVQYRLGSKNMEPIILPPDLLRKASREAFGKEIEIGKDLEVCVMIGLPLGTSRKQREMFLREIEKALP